MQIPNILTILRIFLTLPIFITLLQEHYTVAILLFIIAGISDALDGFIAKYFKFQTFLGSILDPLADKILLISSFVALFLLNLLPMWLLILIFFRDAIIIAAAVGYFFATEYNKNDLIVPTNLSKINTILQIMLVVLLILAQLYDFLDKYIYVCIIITATSTALSGADYTWLWLKKIIFKERDKCNN